jgi:hypothetical protein
MEERSSFDVLCCLRFNLEPRPLPWGLCYRSSKFIRNRKPSSLIGVPYEIGARKR